jgi:hypothetical protein
MRSATKQRQDLVRAAERIGTIHSTSGVSDVCYGRSQQSAINLTRPCKGLRLSRGYDTGGEFWEPLAEAAVQPSSEEGGRIPVGSVTDGRSGER